MQIKYKQNRKKNKSGMAESDIIQTIVNQAAIQIATAVVMALQKVEAGLRSGGITSNLRETHRQRPGRLVLKQPSSNWNVTNKYVELLTLK